MRLPRHNLCFKETDSLTRVETGACRGTTCQRHHRRSRTLHHHPRRRIVEFSPNNNSSSSTDSLITTDHNSLKTTKTGAQGFTILRIFPPRGSALDADPTLGL